MYLMQFHFPADVSEKKYYKEGNQKKNKSRFLFLVFSWFVCLNILIINLYKFKKLLYKLVIVSKTYINVYLLVTTYPKFKNSQCGMTACCVINRREQNLLPFILQTITKIFLTANLLFKSTVDEIIIYLHALHNFIFK